MADMLVEQVDAALQGFEPVEEIANRTGAGDRGAVLRHDHGNVQLARHAHPQPQDLVRDHVAAVEAFHPGDVRLQLGDRLLRFLARHQRHAQVTGEQDAADRVVEVEVAFRVHEVGRQQPQIVRTQRQAAAGIGHADHAVVGLADLGEVRGEALPDARDHQLGLGAGHPAVQRGDDVGVGMRGDQVRELARHEVLRHVEEQLVEGQVAARIDDGAGVTVADQELVGLHGLSIARDEVRVHDHLMRFVSV